MIESRTDETRVRRLAQRHGYIVRRSRAPENINHNHGQFMLIEAERNIPALGHHFDASLEEIEAWLRE